MPSKAGEHLRLARERVRDLHRAGAGGLAVAHLLSDAVDDAVRDVWAAVGGHPKAAVVAVGGYGRREMCPFSDVDLIVLHARRDDVTAPAKALAYDLWDMGLELGYALHTPGEALRLSAQRLDSQTSFLDARLVVGNAELVAEWVADSVARARRSLPAFLEQLREATGSRRVKGGDAGAELEPNLKEGRGGLRDLATLGWLRRAGGPSPQEGQALDDAASFLLRVRHELHFMTGRRSDVLVMRDQAAVAANLGLVDGALRAEDALMRELYGHCRAVAHAVDGALFPVAEVSLPGPLPNPWPETARRMFLDVLRSEDTRRAFESLEASGWLVAAIPEWGAVRCLPQRNIYHRFAVDVHSVETVVALGTLARNDNPIIADAAVDAAADRDCLALACLFHDIGKGSGEDHSVRGEVLARSAAERMGVHGGCADDIAWLVRHHLVLAETATRRDIHDPAVISAFAELAGSARRLRMLLLLTAADGIATGPLAWSPWKATLVTRLFARVLEVWQPADPLAADAGAVLQRVRDDLVPALSGYPEETVRAHVDQMPDEWLVSQPLAALVRQSEAMLSPPPAGEIAITAVLQPESGIWEAAVVAMDRHALFSKVSGGLALHGLSILGAEVYTRDDNVALEVFRLEALGDEEHRFERVVEDVRKALRGRLSLEVRLAAKRRDYAGRPKKGKGDAPRVIVDNQASTEFTLIEVHAEDGVGLLYAITKALAEMELDIHKAKISTYGHDVVDVFYVRDLDGTKATDPEHAQEIEGAVLFALNAVHS